MTFEKTRKRARRKFQINPSKIKANGGILFVKQTG
jgi:hypothetical protein